MLLRKPVQLRHFDVVAYDCNQGTLMLWRKTVQLRHIDATA
jgi:hypothetical protein